MDLSTIMKEGCITFDVDLKSSQEVFSYLINQFYNNRIISSKESFLASVLYRETLSETGIGDGIAIPHGKNDSVIEAGIAFVRLKHPIKWPSIDEKPAEFVFLLAIPNHNDNNQHIQMISELARNLIRRDVIEKIKYAQTASELLMAFK